MTANTRSRIAQTASIAFCLAMGTMSLYCIYMLGRACYISFHRFALADAAPIYGIAAAVAIILLNLFLVSCTSIWETISTGGTVFAQFSDECDSEQCTCGCNPSVAIVNTGGTMPSSGCDAQAGSFGCNP